MQAFAKDVTENMENPANSENESLDTTASGLPLFSTNEIIFPEEYDERPYTRYGYRISNMNFLVPEKTVSEVIQNQNIFSLPNSPFWIEGLINIRGNIIPVMNIDKLLKNKVENYTSILVLNKTETHSTIAIMISELPVSLEHNESETTTQNYPEVIQEYINKGFRQNDTNWVEFNLQELFKNLADKKDI